MPRETWEMTSAGSTKKPSSIGLLAITWETYLDDLLKQYSMNLDEKGWMKSLAGVVSVK